ncbi:MAG: hypothetical protein ACTSPI_07950 [Candidatus Heimdallarchaeaceae archaeon]
MKMLFIILFTLIILYGAVPMLLYIWVRMFLMAKNDEKYSYLKKLKGDFGYYEKEKTK